MMSDSTTAHSKERKSRMLIPHGTEVHDAACSTHAVLVESGLVAVLISVPGATRICVSLLGAGSVVTGDMKPAGSRWSFCAISSVSVALIPAAELRTAAYTDADLASRLRLQAGKQLAQSSIVAACNAQHVLAERTARWLTRFAHYLGPTLPLTHAFLAEMMGVRRAGVTQVLHTLQDAGIIQQDRGRIVVLDEARLQQNACACPAIIGGDESLVSPEMIDSAVSPERRGRAWIERELQARSNGIIGRDAGWIRREATLRMCRDMLSAREMVGLDA